MNQIRNLLICLGLLFYVSLFPSCTARDTVPAGAVLSAMLACEEDCPAGVIYGLGAKEGEIGFLSESLCATLYGSEAVPAEWEYVSDYAIYLTAAEHPCELAVFRCDAGDGTAEIAELCARRLAVLRNYWRGSDYERYTSGARVAVLGNYVLMIVSSDSEAALSEARTVLK